MNCWCILKLRRQYLRGHRQSIFFSFLTALGHLGGGVLQVPPSKSIQASIGMFLESEHLLGENMRFCPSCYTNQPTSVDHSIINSGNFLVVQVKRFVNHGGALIKDNRMVRCFPNAITIPLYADGEVSMHRRYRLVATVNHSGTLENGHYWAYVQDTSKDTSKWFLCNDRAVCPVKPEDLNNISSYIYVFQLDPSC